MAQPGVDARGGLVPGRDARTRAFSGLLSRSSGATGGRFAHCGGACSELAHLHGTGQRRARLDLSWAMVRLSDGTHIGIGQDITQRKRAEALTGQHVAQIETLNQRLLQAMRETDHRVKNNLQSIAALLDVQVMTHGASVPAQELNQVRMHISTLASIHDLLVADVKGEGGASGVSAKAALLKLLPMLQAFVGKERIRWSVDEVYLPIKQGMSLAVLINELVNNAVKHGGHQVDLRVAVVQKEITLEVCDDGPGFAEA